LDAQRKEEFERKLLELRETQRKAKERADAENAEREQREKVEKENALREREAQEKALKEREAQEEALREKLRQVAQDTAEREKADLERARELRSHEDMQMANMSLADTPPPPPPPALPPAASISSAAQSQVDSSSTSAPSTGSQMQGAPLGGSWYPDALYTAPLGPMQGYYPPPPYITSYGMPYSAPYMAAGPSGYMYPPHMGMGQGMTAFSIPPIHPHRQRGQKRKAAAKSEGKCLYRNCNYIAHSMLNRFAS
jgi:hypothetical protein